MTSDEFDAILESRIQKMRQVLKSKAGEYATSADRLHNFKEAAKEFGGTPAESLWGMLKKHLISIKDMIHKSGFLLSFTDSGGHVYGRPSIAQIDEKIGDAMNYLALCEAILLEGHPELLAQSATESQVTIGISNISKAIEKCVAFCQSNPHCRAAIIGSRAIRGNIVITFSNGSSIEIYSVGETTDDVYRFGGCQWQHLEIEDIGAFTEEQFDFLASRVRRPARANSAGKS